MDIESQKRFDSIISKDPESLNVDEIDFLRARRTYLKKSQLKEFASVLEEKAPLYVSEKDKKNQTSETEPVKENEGQLE